MIRSYFQLRNVIFNQSKILSVRNEDIDLVKRWAGHSKWSNIKHTKAEKDHAKNVITSKITKKIIMAVKKGGQNPDFNPALRNLIEEAKKNNLTSSVVEKTIKRAVANKLEKPFWIVFSGPKKINLAFEVSAGSQKHVSSKVASFAKKFLFFPEKNLDDVCKEKGIIVCQPSEDAENILDKATEDAIEIGIEEVEKGDDKMLYFQCYPNMVDTVEDKLEKKGYNVVSATTEIEFAEYVSLNDEDLKSVNELVDKINKNMEDHIERVSLNVK